MTPASFEEDRLVQWTNLPFTSSTVDALKLKLLAWSVLVIVLSHSNVSITTLLFIRFEDPLTKDTAVFYLGPLVVYYFFYWGIRHIEYWRQRIILKPFFIIEELKPSIEEITRVHKRGPSKVNNYQELGNFVKRYTDCEKSIPKIIRTRYLVYAVFDLITPIVIGAWALFLYTKSLIPVTE